MAKTPDQMAAAWKASMQNPQTAQRYKDGINGTSVNPMELAASPDAEQLYLQNIQLAVSSGKRRDKLRAVPLARWKNNAINVGAASLSSGAVKAMDKVSAHFQKWGPIYAQASAAAKALPKGGMANAMARVQAAMQVMMSAAGRG